MEVVAEEEEEGAGTGKVWDSCDSVLCDRDEDELDRLNCCWTELPPALPLRFIPIPPTLPW